MRFQAPRGTEDVLPGDSYRWRRLENEFLAVAERYGYLELRTPVFEDTQLFVRSSGETSDIVTKQMYTFLDKGDRSLTLKPEGTAPAVRAVIEHNLCPPGSIARLAYVTPIFRYERPQKGRLREAHQVGLELLGSEAPDADAEVIELTVRFYEQLGLDATVLLNSLGRESCRVAYREALLSFAKPLIGDLPQETRARAEANPLRLLDSKDPAMIAAMADAPAIDTCWEPETRVRHERLLELLGEAGVRHAIEPSLVRGLDYYTETVFEVQSELIGAQSALCGGGRYDGLVKDLGGPPTPAVGVAMGIERALLAMEAGGVEWLECGAAVFAISMLGCERDLRARVRDLRADGLRVLVDIEGRSFNAQLRQAGKSGARYALILGPDEISQGMETLRDLATGEQRTIPRAEVGRVLRAEGDA